MHDKLYIGFSGLTSDMQTVSQKLHFQMKMYELREVRPSRLLFSRGNMSDLNLSFGFDCRSGK